MEKLNSTNNICQICNGNGYIKITNEEDKKEINIHQCWKCESEGEIYVDESEVVESYICADNTTDHDGELH